MKDWIDAAAQAEVAADCKQAAEDAAERVFDAAHAQASAAGDAGQAIHSEAFRLWMAARAETDTAWGAWSTVMDARPAS